MQISSMDELPCYTGYEQNVYRHVESGIGESDGSRKHKNKKNEGPAFIEVEENLDCSTVPNFIDCRNKTEHRTPVSTVNIGGRSDLVQPRSAVLEYNYHPQPSCTNKSLEEVVSCSRVAETFQGSIFPQGKSCSTELVLPANRDLPNIKVPRKDKDLIKDPLELSNVEVVDLSTPESGCRTSLQTKNRKTDDSKFIDLTKSPIFV